jgi:hypothetical protein
MCSAQTGPILPQMNICVYVCADDLAVPSVSYKCSTCLTGKCTHTHMMQTIQFYVMLYLHNCIHMQHVRVVDRFTMWACVQHLSWPTLVALIGLMLASRLVDLQIPMQLIFESAYLFENMFRQTYNLCGVCIYTAWTGAFEWTHQSNWCGALKCVMIILPTYLHRT